MIARRSLATLVALTATASTGVAAAQASSAPGTPTPGSTLIVWSSGHTRELQVVSPDGSRRTVTRLSRYANLLDWSTDGSRALLTDGTGTSATLTDLTLATSTRKTFRTPWLLGASFAGRRDGEIVVSEGDYGHDPVKPEPVVQRFTLEGVRLGTVSHVLGGAVVSSDGTRIAQEGDGHLTISTLHGWSRQIPAPGACFPVRWWDRSRVLAACFKPVGHHRTVDSLQLISAASGATQRITPADPKHVYDANAWKVGNDLFFRASQSCATTSLARQSVFSTLQTPVTTGILTPLAAVGTTVIMKSFASCTTDAASLVSYDTTSGTVRTIIAPAPGVEGVTQALVLGHTEG